MQDDGSIDLWKLECEFATNPKSLAFVKLANAYVDLGRFVEAMVVAKKGIKHHPELAAGRMILTRIYIDQAKHKKAIEELEQLIRSQPSHPDAFRVLGEIHLKLGRREEGIRSLKKTLDLNPTDQPARNTLLRMGIEYPPPKPRLLRAVPPPPPEPVKNPARSKLRRTIYLATVLTILLSCYLFYTYRAGVKQQKINDLVLKARTLFAQDSFEGYTGALKHYMEILKLDDSHTDSLARAAFSYAVLVGEHNADRKLIDEGMRFLDRARTSEKITSIASAAEGMLKLYGGGGPSEAVRILEKAIKQHPRSLVVRTGLGLAYLKMGDLFRAIGHLKRSALQQDMRAIHLLVRAQTGPTRQPEEPWGEKR
jgi:tetratricopeptide (TPR) repeat protein